MSKSINKKEHQSILGGTLTSKKNIWKDHPFFVKKAKEMKEFIDRVGLPEELTKKKTRKTK